MLFHLGLLPVAVYVQELRVHLLRKQQEWAVPQGRRARSQGDSKVAGQCPYQQGHSPTVPEQGEQVRSGDGNQGQSQPRQVPGDEAGLRSSQQVRLRARHRHTSNVVQARSKGNSYILNA